MPIIPIMHKGEVWNSNMEMKTMYGNGTNRTVYLLGCHFVLFVLRSGFSVYCRPAMDRHDNGDSVLPRCHDWSASRFACSRNLASGLSWHYLDSVQKDTQRATIFGRVGRLSEPTLQSAQTILDQRFCTEAFVLLRQIL